MQQANAVEHDAEIAQVGMWSPSEIIHWKPPSDAAMKDLYDKHPDWFQQVSALARDDERLVKVVRSPESIARARSGGVPQAKLDAYVGLLEKPGVNETIANVLGLGQLSLVKADIIVGLFDNGIIKGWTRQQQRAEQPIAKLSYDLRVRRRPPAHAPWPMERPITMKAA
jgi:hypothetical protein